MAEVETPQHPTSRKPLGPPARRWRARKRPAHSVAGSLEKVFQISRPVENPQDQHIVALDAVKHEVFWEP